MATVIRRYFLNSVSDEFSDQIGSAYLSDESTPSVLVDLSLDNTVINYSEDSDAFMVELGYTFQQELTSPASPSLNVGFTAIMPTVVNRAYTFGSGADNGEYYIGGSWGANTNDANLTQASQTVTYGNTVSPYGAHAFIVAGGAGAASGGTGTVEIEVSGTRIEDDGTRTASHTEILIADITGLALDQFEQTTAKWIGQVTFTLQNSTGSTHTTFNADFNYGLLTVETYRNSEFRPLELTVGGYCNATDIGFNVQLYHHDGNGWTYAATGFTPGNTPIADFESEYGTESDIQAGQQFHWDRDSINTLVRGDLDAGVIIKVTTSVNSAVRYLNANLIALVNP